MYKKREILVPLIILIILVQSGLVLADSQNFYLFEDLELEFTLSGEMDFVEESPQAVLRELNTTILLYPYDNLQQKLLDIETEGEILDDKVVFSWNEDQLRTLRGEDFSYTALVKTDYERKQIPQRVPFPIRNVESYLINEPKLLEYLEETESIDYLHPDVIAKANFLVEGKTDLFEATFALASWVEENIAYDLNSLTEKSTQKSSWVLENRQGVCDEMTSLFIAMARSVGIPARFITGMTYTNSDLFDDPWQAHGWAEVYFPEYGWISFDPTFGEFGYVDVTHIKLKESKEPLEASTLYQWVSRDVQISASNLNLDVEILDNGNLITEEFKLEMETLSGEIGLGSFSTIKALVKNENDYYTTTRLSLALPEEIEVFNRKERNVLLSPDELREVYWTIRVPELDKNYIYTFPYVVYTEKNISLSDSFKARKDAVFYSFDEVKELIPKEDEKEYSRQVIFDCEYEELVAIKEETTITCSLKNVGNAALENLEFCIDKTCEEINLPINQEHELEVSETFSEAAWQNVVIKASNNLIESSELASIKALDPSKINLKASVSEDIHYKDDFVISFELEQKSFSSVDELTLSLSGSGVKNSWEFTRLDDKETIILESNSKGLSNKNKFVITLEWKDELGRNYEYKEGLIVEVQGNSFLEKFVMFFNKIF